MLVTSVEASKPLTLVSCRNIGIFATKALQAPAASAYHNQAITLADDGLSYNGCNRVLQERLGYLPHANDVQVRCVSSVVVRAGARAHDKTVQQSGARYDIPAFKELDPGLQSWETG